MHKVTASSLLLVLQKLAERSLGIVSTIVLARLLTPEDFGVIAIAMLVLWFVEALSSASADTYIIQKEILNSDDLNSAWTLDVFLKLVSFILILAIAPLAAYIKDSTELFYVIIAVGFILPIKSVKNPGLWLLRREQNYKIIVKFAILVKAISIAIVIPLAFYWQSFWALVVGQVGSSVLLTIFSYKISNYRPKFCVSQIAPIWQFSKWLIPQSVLGYVRTHIDTLIVGNRYSAAELGAYNNLKYFASIPMLQIITPLAAPLHAELGQVQSNPKEMFFQSAIVLKLLSFVVAPFSAFFLVNSKEIVELVLGSQWVPFHPIFGYLGLMIIPFVLLAQAGRILMVKGKTKLLFLYELLSSMIVSMFLIFTPFLVIEEFAILRVSCELVMASIFFLYASKVVFGAFSVNSFLTLIFANLMSVFALYFIRIEIDGELSLFWHLLIMGMLSILVAFSLLIVWYYFLASERERGALGKFNPFR